MKSWFWPPRELAGMTVLGSFAERQVLVRTRRKLPNAFGRYASEHDRCKRSVGC
jgi:hypothetical protein